MVFYLKKWLKRKINFEKNFRVKNLANQVEVIQLLYVLWYEKEFFFLSFRFVLIFCFTLDYLLNLLEVNTSHSLMSVYKSKCEGKFTWLHCYYHVTAAQMIIMIIINGTLILCCGIRIFIAFFHSVFSMLSFTYFLFLFIPKVKVPKLYLIAKKSQWKKKF